MWGMAFVRINELVSRAHYNINKISCSPGLPKNLSSLTIDDMTVSYSTGCLSTVLAVLTSTAVVLDISAHQDVLTLACNLFAGKLFQISL